MSRASTFPSLYRALVVDNTDPDSRGRLRLQIPQVLGNEWTGWAWPVSAPGATPPTVAIGDMVFASFEGGDPNYPVWMAGGGGSGGDHTHATYALLADFDLLEADYQAHNHDGEYSLLAHLHDDRYSQLGHLHDGRYSLLAHLHDDRYSLLAHDHAALYSPLGHTHGGGSGGDLTNYVTKSEIETITGAKTFTAETTFHTGTYVDPDSGVTRAIKVGAGGVAVLGGIKTDSLSATGNISGTGRLSNVYAGALTASSSSTYGFTTTQDGTAISLGADATAAYLQSWNSKPLYINNQGNEIHLRQATTVNGALSVVGAATVGTTLGVSGTTTLSSDLSVAGTSTLAELSAQATSVTTLTSTTSTTLASATIKLANGTASAPSLAFANSPGTGLYRNGTDILGFAAGGADAMRLDAQKNLTVLGTTLTLGSTAANSVNRLDMANPGTGGLQEIRFLRATDTAGIRLSEPTADQLEMRFYLSDNPDAGDAFSFYQSDFQGVAGDWQPLRLTGLVSQYQAREHQFAGLLRITPASGTGTHLSSGVLGTISVAKNGTLTLTPDASAYTGTTNVYWVTIDGNGTPNTFKWGRGAVTSTAVATLIQITGAAQPLENGVTVTFNATTGGAIGDTYQFRVISTGAILNADGSTAKPSYSFGNDVDTGLYRPAANEIGFAAGGTSRAVLSSAWLSLATTSGLALNDGQVRLRSTTNADHYLKWTSVNDGAELAGRTGVRLGLMETGTFVPKLSIDTTGTTNVGAFTTGWLFADVAMLAQTTVEHPAPETSAPYTPLLYVINSQSGTGKSALVRTSTASGWSTSFGTIEETWWHAFGTGTGAVRWGYDGTNLRPATAGLVGLGSSAARWGAAFTGALDVAGAATVSGTATLGAASIGGTLSVTGASTLAAVTASSATVNGAVNVTNANVTITANASDRAFAITTGTLSGRLAQVTSAGGLATGSALGDLVLRADADTQKLFLGTGDSAHELVLTNGTATVNGTFTSTGAASLNSTLAVTGTSTFTGRSTHSGGVSVAANSYGTADGTFFGWDASTTPRMGFSKKVGVPSKLGFASIPFAITEYVGQTSIDPANAQTDRLTIATGGAVTINQSLTTGTSLAVGTSLSVVGASTLAALTAGASTLTSLSVSGAATVLGVTTVDDILRVRKDDGTLVFELNPINSQLTAPAQSISGDALVDGSVVNSKLSLAAVASRNVATGTLRDSDSSMFRTATASTVDQQNQPVGGITTTGATWTRQTDGTAFDGVAFSTIANTKTDGHMLTGPFYTGLKAGKYRVTFYLKVSSTASSAEVVRLSVSSSAGFLENNNAQVSVSPSQLSTSYVGYAIPMTVLQSMTASTGLETRVQYKTAAGAVDVSFSHVTVELFDGLVNNEVQTQFINDLAVTNAKILDLTVSKLTAGTINTDEINLGTAGRIFAGASKTAPSRLEFVGGGTDASRGVFAYAGGVQTVRLSADGTFQLRGAASGTRLEITNAAIELYNGTTRTVYLNGATGTAEFSGTITASAGTIGGFSIGATSLTGGTGSSTVSLSTVAGIHLGDATFAAAPFSVSQTGALKSTSGLIGSWTISSTGLSTGATNATAIGLIPGTGIYLGHLSFASAPFRVTNAGVLTASSGTVGGWTLAATTLTGGTLTLDSDAGAIYAGAATTRVQLQAGQGIWAGADARDSAPFRVTTAGVLTAVSGTVGGFTLSSTELFSGTGATRVQLSSNGALGGIWLGADARDSAPFRVTPAGLLTATNAVITGTVTASAGTIGGFTLSGSSLTAGNGTASEVGLSTTAGIWLGGTSVAAPFRVTTAGVLTATNATITGTVTASAGTIGGFTLTATSLFAGTGATRVQMSNDAAGGGFWAGADARDSAPFRVTQAGALTATSATITGSITATGGSITGNLQVTGLLFAGASASTGNRLLFTSSALQAFVGVEGSARVEILNTGSFTLRSALSSSRIAITNTGIEGYLGAEATPRFQLTAAGGFSFSSALAGTRVQLDTARISLFRDAVETFRADAATGNVTLSGTLTTSGLFASDFSAGRITTAANLAYTNPELLTDTAFWNKVTIGSTMVISRQTATGSGVGAGNAIRYAKSADPLSTYAVALFDYGAGGQTRLKRGLRYTLSFYARSISGSTAFNYSLSQSDSGNNVTGSQNITLTTTWTRYSVTFDAAADASTTNQFYFASSAPTTDFTYELTAVQIEQGSLTAYVNNTARAVLESAGLSLYKGDGTRTVFLDSTTGDATFTGNVTGSAISGSTVTGSTVTGSTVTGGSVLADTVRSINTPGAASSWAIQNDVFLRVWDSTATQRVLITTDGNATFSGTLTASSAVITGAVSQTNLLRNPSFEGPATKALNTETATFVSTAACWIHDANLRFRRSVSVNSRGGTGASLLLGWTNNTGALVNTQIRSIDYPAKPGEEFTASGYAYLGSTHSNITGNHVFLSLRFVDSGGASLQTNSATTFTSQVLGAYERKNVTATAPANTVGVRIVISANTPNTAVASARLDDFQLERGPLATTFHSDDTAIDKFSSGVFAPGGRIIAGDPDGSYAEMSEAGFKVYTADVLDGVPNEAISLGTAGSDFLELRNALGTTVATLNDAGVANLNGLSVAAEPEFMGETFSSFFTMLHRGTLARGIRQTDGTPTTTTEVPYLELQVDLVEGRLYKIEATGFGLNNNTANARMICRLRFTRGGAAVGVTSQQASGRRYTLPNANVSVAADTLYYHVAATAGSGVEEVRFLLSYLAEQGTGFIVPHSVVYLNCEDIGPLIPDVGIDRSGAVTTKKTYVKTYTSTASGTYRADGSKRSDTTDVVQGEVDTFNGVQKGLWTFPSFTADLAGSTINKVEIYAYANHWYNNSGGTARIHTHGHTTVPASNPTLTFRTESTGWPKPGGRWVTLPSTVHAGLISGAIRGFGMGPTPSGLIYYGRFNGGTGAQMRITYTK